MPRDVLRFELHGEQCALPLEDVREVLRAALPARLPDAPAVVQGVLNVRGELVPLLDLRSRFHLPPRPLRAGAGSQWEAAFVDLFLALLERGVVDTLTRQQLTGETGEGQPPVVSGGVP